MITGPVAVTGGSGVVGRALVKRLTADGVEVAALSRNDASDVVLTRMGARPVRGDILDSASLRRAFDGVGLVFHVAGLNLMCPRDPGELLRVNVDGSRNVLAAATRTGVRRMIHTSSAATIGERAGVVGNENTDHRGSYLSHYERSKHLAEAALRVSTGPTEVVFVNPSSVQGPGRATGTGKLILDLLNGRLPALVDTRVSIVDIDDCARGHVLAAVDGRPGERYLLNSFTLDLRQAVRILESVVGRTIRVRYLPAWVATVAGTMAEAIFRVVGRPPPLCREMVRSLRHGHAYDGSRAARELGLIYTDPTATLTRLVAWFRSEGMLREDGRGGRDDDPSAPGW